MMKKLICCFAFAACMILFMTVPAKAANEVSIAQYQKVQNQLNAMTALVGMFSAPGLYDPTMASVEQSLNEQLISLQMLNGSLNPTLGSISQYKTDEVDRFIRDQQQQVMALFAWQQQQAAAQALMAQQQAMLAEYQKQQAALMDAQMRALGLK